MNVKNIHWAGNVDLSYLEGDELFRAIWWKTESIPGSFTRLNAAKYYERALIVPSDGVIVEVGVDQGRSASILLAIATMTGVKLHLVDSWESILIDNKAKVEALIKGFDGVDVTVHHMRSEDAAKIIPSPIDMVHIDAHHYTPSIELDCESWLPKLKSGGVALFHDYASTFPDVTAAVDKYTESWDDLGAWDSLAIRRKP